MQVLSLLFKTAFDCKNCQLLLRPRGISLKNGRELEGSTKKESRPTFLDTNSYRGCNNIRSMGLKLRRLS